MIYAVALSTLGWALAGFAATMLIPAFVAFGYGEIDQGWTFLVSSGLTLFAGGALVIATRGTPRSPSQREAFALAVLIWLVLPVFGALPFFYIGATSTATDAYFEAMSGLTTTGATVLSNLEITERSILIWRALLQWLGGLATLMLTIVLLSFYSVGAMKLFRSAMPRGERHDLRIQLVQSLRAVWWVYFALTGACALFLVLTGLNIFESICLAMSTLSTGGFSTRDGSLASFSTPSMEIVLIIFMLAGAINFTFHWALFHGRGWRNYVTDPEIRHLAVFALGASIVLWMVIAGGEQSGMTSAGRNAVFSSVSMITTTGYFNSDPSHWPLFSILFLISLALVGGCAGSTSGGMKLLRFSILIKVAVREINRLPHPSAITPVTYAGHVIDESPLGGILTFFCTYMISLGVIGLALSAFGLEFHQAYTAAAAALSNTGPAMILISGNDGEYESLAAGAKWLLCLAMLIGRLEIFALLAFVAGALRRG